MSLLLPGYPRSNPILMGVAAIEGGGSPDTALAARDQALTSPFDFAGAALEAICWFSPSASPFLEDLSNQATAAFERCAPDQRQRLHAQAVSLATAGRDQILGLVVHWGLLEASA